VDYQVPINFASIQTRSGLVFITGGSKNENESFNDCFEYFERDSIEEDERDQRANGFLK
jgi:hypothetical protein